ncbi:MAG: dephospho-CoA kinase [Bacteroidota bacterium]
MPLKIGLTGGIGSGKTTVAKIFELLQVPVYYADEASKRLYHTNENLKAAIKKNFGDDVYENDILNKEKLASIVFASEQKLKLLNALAHPPTIQDATDWMQKQTAPYIIKEAALLFESGSNKSLDYVIGVYAPEELRITRVMKRDATTEEHVRNRINRQMNEEEKMKICDWIIKNTEEELLIPSVLEMHDQLLELARNRL